jgi:hypothetical protein
MGSLRKAFGLDQQGDFVSSIWRMNLAHGTGETR